MSVDTLCLAERALSFSNTDAIKLLQIAILSGWVKK